MAREGYGMSEVGGAITVMPIDASGSQGPPGPLSPAASCASSTSAADARLPAGERGEVQVRSPSVMRGYRGDLAATRTVIDRDGWLSTGDIGYLDDDGYLFLVDRKKEPIIRSGYNVYPREVEDVIMSYPGVLEVAVVGVPHEVHGARHRRAGRARLRRRPRSGGRESVRARAAGCVQVPASRHAGRRAAERARPERFPNAKSTARRSWPASRQRSGFERPIYNRTEHRLRHYPAALRTQREDVGVFLGHLLKELGAPSCSGFRNRTQKFVRGCPRETWLPSPHPL